MLTFEDFISRVLVVLLIVSIIGLTFSVMACTSPQTVEVEKIRVFVDEIRVQNQTEVTWANVTLGENKLKVWLFEIH